MKRLFLVIIALVVSVSLANAQKTCVIANAEDHVPIREALIHTDNNHWARTDYRGYWTMKYQFDSATFSKPGYVKTTVYLKNLPDTLFLLPESHQLGTVEVWGKDKENINRMKEQAAQEALGAAGASSGASFDFANMLDKRGRRDRKHMKKAHELFKEMEEKKDPIVDAYKKAMREKQSE